MLTPPRLVYSMPIANKFVCCWCIAVFLTGLFVGPNFAIANTNICSTGLIQLPQRTSAPSTNAANPPIDIIADSIDSPEEGLVSLKGKVELVQGSRIMLSNRLLYRKREKLIEAHDNVRVYTKNGDLLITDFLTLNVDTGKGNTAEARFKVADRKRVHEDKQLAYLAAYGTARKVILDGASRLILLDADYVNCLENKGDILVSAKELRLNVKTGETHAKQVKVRILNPKDHAKLIDKL